TEADAVKDLGRAPGRAAEQANLSLARRELARDELQERRLPRAVRTQQPRHPGRELEAHVVERDHGPVPAQGPDELDRRRGRAHPTTATARTRERRIARQRRPVRTSTPADQAQGTPPCWPRPKITLSRTSTFERGESSRASGRPKPASRTTRTISRPATSAT